MKLHNTKHARYPARVTKWRTDECSLVLKDILKSVFSFNGIFVFFKIALSFWSLPLFQMSLYILFCENFFIVALVVCILNLYATSVRLDLLIMNILPLKKQRIYICSFTLQLIN